MTAAEPYFGAAFGVAGADFLAGTVELPRREGFLCVCISLVTFFKPKIRRQKLFGNYSVSTSGRNTAVATEYGTALQITSTFGNITTLVD